MYLQTTMIGGNRSVTLGDPDAPPLITPTDNVAVISNIEGEGVVADMPVITLDATSQQEPHPDVYVHSPDPVFSTTVVESGTGPKLNRGFN